MSTLRRGALGALMVLWAATASAAETDEKGKSKGPAPFESLEFRLVGPFTGGRVSRAVGGPGGPDTYYLASASGGVWKSVDGGLRWSPIFDDQPIASIGSIAVAPSDPNVIYVGSGEANIRGNLAPGNGIYKSTDAGRTWNRLSGGFPQGATVGRIGLALAASRPGTVYAVLDNQALRHDSEPGSTSAGKQMAQKSILNTLASKNPMPNNSRNVPTSARLRFCMSNSLSCFTSPSA